MPWKVRKRKCRQGDGDKGKYVVVKVKRGGGTKQSSCHTSKKRAQAATRARYASAYGESVMKITAGQLRQIIKEELTALNERAGDGELSPEEAEALRSLVGDAVTDSQQDRPSYLPDVTPKSLPSWAEAVRKDMVAMKTASEGDHFELAIRVNNALDKAGVDFTIDSQEGDKVAFYKDGKELASLDIDGLQDATAVSKAWADIVRQLGIS